MMLIQCPDCNKDVSQRAEYCPHCGCPSKFFNYTDNDSGANMQSEPEKVVFTRREANNYIIAFEQEYHSLFSMSHYITQREIKRFYTAFEPVYCLLEDKDTSWKGINVSTAENLILKFRSLNEDVAKHNNIYVSNKVNEYNEYFDGILDIIDPKIMLDDEQRRAVVTDDDYVLLVAGAGTGKTTTMAAKVKYLVDKCNIKPDDIIAISYTNKAINELRERINMKLDINVKISTFHAFAFDVVRQQRETLPEVNYSAYKYILEILEKALFNNKSLMKNLVMFLG